MAHDPGPLLVRAHAEALSAARAAGAATWTGSFDLGRSQDEVALDPDTWTWRGRAYPYPGKLKDRTIHHWDGEDFVAVSRYDGALIKLVPTEWGAPTFEIDGIKMLPTSKLSPFEDARRKVELVAPAGKVYGTWTRPVVRFGKPLDFSRYAGMENDRYILRSITDEIMYEIMHLSGQEYVDTYASRAKEEARKAEKGAKDDGDAEEPKLAS